MTEEIRPDSPLRRLSESDLAEALATAATILGKIKPNGHYEGRPDEKRKAEQYFDFIKHQITEFGSPSFVYKDYLTKIFDSEKLPEQERQEILKQIKSYDEILSGRIDSTVA